MDKSHHWCFQLNDYTSDDINRLSNPIPGVSYIVFGRGVGATGIRHLQGIVSFESEKALHQAQELIGNAILSITRYLYQSVSFRKEQGDFTEVGSLSDQDSDDNIAMEKFKMAVKNGMTAPAKLREHHSLMCAKYPSFVREYVNDNTEYVGDLWNPNVTPDSKHEMTYEYNERPSKLARTT